MSSPGRRPRESSSGARRSTSLVELCYRQTPVRRKSQLALSLSNRKLLLRSCSKAIYSFTMNYFNMVGRRPGESQELREAIRAQEKKTHSFVLHVVADENVMNLHLSKLYFY